MPAEDLLEENTGNEPEAFPVPEDQPIEGPANVPEPPIPTPAAPGPDVQAALDEEVPPVPPEAPGNIGHPAPLPGTVPPPSPGEPSKPVTAPDAMETAGKEADLDQKKATIAQQQADREAAIAKEHEDDARLAYADYLERRQKAQDNLAAKIQRFEEQGRIVDPRQHTDMTKARLSVIFGGLGSAFRSAGGGEAGNHALSQLQQKWGDDLERQKANIGLLKDSVVTARAGVKDVDEARAELEQAANAKTLAQYNSAIKQGERQLKALGFSQADIDADKRIQSLVAGRAKVAADAQKARDAHDLNQAKTALYLRKAGRGGAGGGGVSAKEQRAQRKEARDERRLDVAEAAPTVKEMNESVKEFTAKGGVKEGILHGKRALAAIEKDPNNNTNWTNLVDAMIRSNTGRSAILSQYKLYTGHATGDVDLASQWFHKAIDGGLSEAQKKTILGAANGTLGQLESDAKDFYDNFRQTYDNDPRLSNAEVAQHYKALEKTTFGTLPGYQKGEANPAPKAAAPAAPADKRADPMLAKARAAIASPKATPEQKKNAAAYIKRVIGG
jgi:hypothetical protein